MLTLISRLGVACLTLLLSVGLAHAVDIDLSNSDGTKTRLKGLDGAAQTSLATLLKAEEPAAIGSYISTGSGSNKVEVLAVPGVLHSMIAYSTHSASVWGRCAEAVTGSTTPGTTAVKFRFHIAAGGVGGPALPGTLGGRLTALTCWFVTDLAEASGTTAAPVNTITVVWSTK